MTAVRLLQEAEEELRAAAKFYEAEQPGLGRALLQGCVVRFDLSQSIRSQHASSVLKFVTAPSRDFRIVSTIERGQMRFWLLPLVTGTDVLAIGARALSHNKQLQSTVIPHPMRAASASFHYAHAARWTAHHAAAQLRR